MAHRKLSFFKRNYQVPRLHMNRGALAHVATLPWQGGVVQLTPALSQRDAAPMEQCVVGHELYWDSSALSRDI